MNILVTPESFFGRVRRLASEQIDIIVHRVAAAFGLRDGYPTITRNVPPPPVSDAPDTPTVESLFGRGRAPRIGGAPVRSQVAFGGKVYDVDITRDPSGALEMLPIEFPKVRARSKPTGVSATTGGGVSGVTQVGTRASMDTDSFGSALQPFVVFARSAYWSKFILSDSLSLAELRNVPLDRIGELLSTVSPEVSAGLYIRNTFANSGYEVHALKLDSDEIDERANAVLKDMRKRVGRMNGTEDVFFTRAFTTLFMRGAFLGETVIAQNARDFLGIVTPDPKTLQFRRVTDPELGTRWDFGQIQNGQFRSLDTDMIRYIPFQPFTDSIEGNPLITSSFFIAIFLMAVLRDFKRVVQQQGYPRYDITVDLEKLKNLMPSEAEDDEKVFQVWAEKLRDSIKEYISGLEPDETFIHFDGVTVNDPVGAMGTNSLTAIDGLFKGLERIAARSMKVPPLLMGITDSVSEANANRQMEAFLKDTQSCQHIIENGMGDLYGNGLQAQGFQARVVVRFAQLRSSERLRDAQADMVEGKVAGYQYQMGWISQDEAARRGAKVEKSDVPEPRSVPAETGGDIGDLGGTPDAGVNRGVRVPTLGELEKAKAIFQEFAPPESADIIFADSAES